MYIQYSSTACIQNLCVCACVYFGILYVCIKCDGCVRGSYTKYTLHRFMSNKDGELNGNIIYCSLKIFKRITRQLHSHLYIHYTSNCKSLYLLKANTKKVQTEHNCEQNNSRAPPVRGI